MDDRVKKEVSPQVTAEPLRVDEMTPADVRTQVDPHELKIGSEVFVQCKKGEEWIATLLRPCEKSGEYGFYIRYKGQKRRRKVTDEEWVAVPMLIFQIF